MKRFFFLALALLSVASMKAQVAAQPADALVAKEMEFDFGKIPQGKPVYHFFEVLNKSSKAFKLDNVTATCGCTTPEWSKDEIPAGGSSKIKVGYNAASHGAFEKFITITYNGNETKQIKIKGEVWQAPAGAAPANPSIQFLKQQIQ
ncbi:MAG: hypothetical protein JWP69_120 [Flaviaesturariibacter sp.]|nr:hypothetical protein [Flaviaesturariibacter sp.]